MEMNRVKAMAAGGATVSAVRSARAAWIIGHHF
jgi:hypothetical protein